MEHQYSWSVDNHNTMTIWEDDAILATIEDCFPKVKAENLFKDVVYELRGIDLDCEG